MIKALEQAFERHESAAQDLCDMVKNYYPVGKVFSVKLGGHKLRLEVTSHSEMWWSRPGEITGKNIRTGKVRRFYPDQII